MEFDFGTLILFASLACTAVGGLWLIALLRPRRRVSF
jgi:hypothetical protein